MAISYRVDAVHREHHGVYSEGKSKIGCDEWQSKRAKFPFQHTPAFARIV